MYNLDLAVENLNKEQTDYAATLLKRFREGESKLSSMFETLPVYLKNVINKRISTQPSWLLTSYPETVFAAFEGTKLASQFKSLSEWEYFKKKPSKDNLNLHGAHTDETMAMMFDFCELIMHENRSSIIVDTDIKKFDNTVFQGN